MQWMVKGWGQNMIRDVDIDVKVKKGDPLANPYFTHDLNVDSN